MKAAPAALLVAALLAPGRAAAHAVFGDLGPFFDQLLHPVADPAQGLLLAAVAVFLARQPLASVRVAFAAFCLACAAAALTLLAAGQLAPGMRFSAALSAGVGLLAVSGWHPPVAVSLCVVVACALTAAALPGPAEEGAALLWLAGSVGGIALIVLYLWALADWARARLHPVAPAVAGAWVATISLLVLALPA